MQFYGISALMITIKIIIMALLYKHLKETQISQKEAWMGKISED